MVCIASGPSLTAEDCEAVRGSGLYTIVTNTTFQRCLWANAVLAYDFKWWKRYKAEVLANFKGRRLTCAAQARMFGAMPLQSLIKFRSFGNSGASAISLAALARASRVVLVGYDCQFTGGKTHWHGDHPPGMSNAISVEKWPAKFAQVAAYAAQLKVPVVNASRATALTCFPRVQLEDEIDPDQEMEQA